ncbi:hypothetical protein L479_03208 [Exiguobacterium sp. S17]|nr:hypothetical protein L479_03208 [Exiguobacterium sp. S17]
MGLLMAAGVGDAMVHDVQPVIWAGFVPAGLSRAVRFRRPMLAA